MNNVKIGIPNSFFYYEYGLFLKDFFTKLGFNVIESPESCEHILNLSNKYNSSEMCLPLKLFLGHIAYLDKKVDYILNIRFSNNGLYNQGCTNLLGTYDLINNLFNTKILNINIDMLNYKSIYKQIEKLMTNLNIQKKEIKEAYLYSRVVNAKRRKVEINRNLNKLYDNKKKILLVGHAYVLEDKFIGSKIKEYLDKYNIIYVESNKFDKDIVKEMSKSLSHNIYWKESKIMVGSVEYCKHKVDGIILLEAFPCALDSMINELIIRKYKLPIIKIVVDDINSLTGIDTRIESFIDIIE